MVSIPHAPFGGLHSGASDCCAIAAQGRFCLSHCAASMTSAPESARPTGRVRTATAAPPALKLSAKADGMRVRASSRPLSIKTCVSQRLLAAGFSIAPASRSRIARRTDPGCNCRTVASRLAPLEYTRHSAQGGALSRGAALLCAPLVR